MAQSLALIVLIINKLMKLKNCILFVLFFHECVCDCLKNKKTIKFAYNLCIVIVSLWTIYIYYMTYKTTTKILKTKLETNNQVM